MACKYCDGSGIGFNENKELCVFENHGHPEVVIPVGKNASVRAYVNFCPMCGRQLPKAEQKSQEEKNTPSFDFTLKLPIPMGSRVWTFHTNCCDACHYQKREDKPIACSKNSPCHTRKHSIQGFELNLRNVEDVVANWGVFYFASSAEAEAAGNKRVEENIKKMREFGYAIDDEGKANYLLTESEAKIFNMKFKEN